MRTGETVQVLRLWPVPATQSGGHKNPMSQPFSLERLTRRFVPNEPTQPGYESKDPDMNSPPSCTHSE